MIMFQHLDVQIRFVENLADVKSASFFLLHPHQVTTF
jgi:hypothetical protein